MNTYPAINIFHTKFGHSSWHVAIFSTRQKASSEEHIENMTMTYFVLSETQNFTRPINTLYNRKISGYTNHSQQTVLIVQLQAMIAASVNVRLWD